MPTLRKLDEADNGSVVECDFPPEVPEIGKVYPFGPNGFKTSIVTKVTKSDEEGFEFQTLNNKYRVLYNNL